MTRRQVQFEIDLETRKAIRSAKKLADAAGDIEDALDDAETAGQTFARGLGQSADRMIAEIDDTRRMIDLLDQALGDVDGDRLEDVVRQMKRVGLTAADVEADLDDIVAGMRRMDDVKLAATRAGFDDVGDAVNEVRDAQDRARGATNSFVGNALGELPGVSEAFGPAGEAVSQLTEGLLEGEIGLKNLVKAGAGMGAIAVAVLGIQRHFSNLAETRAFRRERVDEFVEALRDAGDAAENLADQFADAGEIQAETWGELDDIVPILARVNVTVDEWIAAVRGGESAGAEFMARLEALGVAGDDFRDLLAALITSQDRYADATDRAAAESAVFGETQGSAWEAVERFTAAAGDQADELDNVTAAAGDAVEGITDLATAYEKYLAKITDRDAYLDLKDTFDDVERTAVEAYAAAAAGAGDAETKARAAERAVNANREAVARYLVEVLGVPETMVTDFLAEIDGMSLADVEAKLDRLERTRQAKLIVVEEYRPDPRRWATPGSVRYEATGGLTGTQRAIAGEHGRPELVDGRLVTGPTAVGPGRRVTGEAETRRLLARIAANTGGAGVVNVYMPPGVDATAAARAIARHTARNGTGTAVPRSAALR